MHELIRGARRRLREDAGFTLPELVITVAIMGIIASGLAGVVISYLKHTVDTQARLTESHDVQFAAAYWQRDVASIGVRGAYDNDPAVHSFPLQQSVNVTPACALPAGTEVVTLAWSEYSSLSSTDPPVKVTVSYVAQLQGTTYDLLRVRCGTAPATVKVADNLSVVPTVKCDGTAADCDASAVPVVVTMALTVVDPDGHGTSTYAATLTGERRQT
ncbi:MULTISPECIES: PulJ/GspJ family protein [Nocardioides]|uniref:Type II secretion system protein J n=1 Tax=Nocardioides vastitatis TaxID=2568655 RepID=A0ABW0ZB12_9ACTN|nr:type II secretion system protein [Nocardioides sp.]